MSPFADDRHVLYTGWVIGIAVRHGLEVAAVYDEAGNYTDRLVVDLGDVSLELVVPPPPAEWVL